MQTATFITNDAATKRPPATPEQAITLLTTVLSYMLEAGAVVPRRTVEGELQLRIRFPGVDIKIVEDAQGVVSFVLAPKEVAPAPVVETEAVLSTDKEIANVQQ